MNLEYHKIKNPDTALGWNHCFEVLEFKPGLEYWRQMNLHLTHEQARIVHREAIFAATACRQPLPEAEQAPDQQYLQWCQRILNTFLETVEAECGRDVVKEVLAWAEADLVIAPWSSKAESQWLFTLLEIKSNFEKLTDEIDLEAKKLQEIAKIIEIELWFPWSSLQEDFKRICELLDGSQEESETCKKRFIAISLVIGRVSVRRCWGKIQQILSSKDEDAIFRWFLDHNRKILSAFPENKRKILPLRVSEFRNSGDRNVTGSGLY